MEEQDKTIENVENSTKGRLCYLCGATLDSNKCCTNIDCPIYGIPQ